MNENIFKQINNVVLDLQCADYQNFERPLKKLGQLLRHDDLKVFNDKLKEKVDLQSFLTESNKTESSMVGSARLVWPDNESEILGLTLLLIEKLSQDFDFVIEFSSTFFYVCGTYKQNIHSMVKHVIVPFSRDYKEHILNELNIVGEQLERNITLSRKVFIVHGHDDGARESVARFLEKIGFIPIILHEQANQGKTIIEKIDTYGNVGFAIVLLTPDDEGRAKGSEEFSYRARQNVVLELGYFIGRLGRNKVCALKRGNIEIPSDFLGVVWENMDPSGGWKNSLARELKAAGHHIDWNLVMR